MTPAARWLREHLSDAPPRLLAAMEAALPAEAGASAADDLAEGSLALLRRLDGGCRTRDQALALLAADALMTHALELCASEDPGALAAFAERWGGAGRLGELAGEPAARP